MGKDPQTERQRNLKVQRETVTGRIHHTETEMGRQIEDKVTDRERESDMREKPSRNTWWYEKL